MRKVCLTLPTNRPCAPALTALAEEAAYAAARFGVEAHVLVLDSADEAARAVHDRALRAVRTGPAVVVHHFDEDRQRILLREVIDRTGLAKPELLLDLMLPDAVSYGACTNRAFLIAAALGCESVHRRDSDSRYQELDGEPVYPVEQELRSLGKRAADVADTVAQNLLDPVHADKTVSMVGSSFIGEMSVDIEEMYRIDPGAYYDVVGLWAPMHWSAEAKRRFVDDSFHGAGRREFSADHATLTLVDPMRVDMCNIAFHGVHEQVPLMPAVDTIGSDYFLIHLVTDATLPGVLHNRNIVNFHTGERKTDQGFLAYQVRFAKFFLSMLYLNFAYDRMGEAGGRLLDEHGRVRGAGVVRLLREAAALDTSENVVRLETIDRAYRRLGGRYAAVADVLFERRERLLDEARHDIEDFALLTEAWPALIEAARSTGPHPGPYTGLRG